MSDKRKYPRYTCQIKTQFDYYEGDPDSISVKTASPSRGKGFILDVSAGGLFLVTRDRVQVNMPIRVSFKSKKKKFELAGTIVRTGLLENNPTEVARKFSEFSDKGDAYVAVQFDKPIDGLSQDDI